jgi:hypothetical protein
VTLAGVAPPTMRPVKVALSISVAWVVTKSSAVSVSSLPGLAVRDSVAIFPSGSPVLKKNGCSVAAAGGRRKQTDQRRRDRQFQVTHRHRIPPANVGLNADSGK